RISDLGFFNQSLLTSAATRFMGRVNGVVPNAAAEELQLFGESENRPGQSACPGGEWRVSLLRIRTTEDAIGDVEHRFVRGSAGHVVGVAAFAIINVVTRGVRRVLDETLKKRNLPVLLPHEHVAELMRHG